MGKLLQLDADVRIQAAAGKDRRPRIAIEAYGGGVMNVSGFGPVVIDLSGLTWQDPVGILADHKNEIASAVGHGTPRVVDGSLVVDGTVDSGDTKADRVVALGKSGFPLRASVGVDPARKELIRPGASVEVNGRTIKAGPRGFTLVHTGTLLEITVLPIGADRSTSVCIAARFKGANMVFNQWLEANGYTPGDLDEKQLAPLQAAFDAEQTDPDNPTDRLGTASELRRQDAILKIQPSEHLSIKAQAIEDNWPLERVERDILRAGRPKAPVGHIHGGTVANESVLEAALFGHLGEETLGEAALGAQTMQRGRDMHVRHVMDILQASLHLQGIDRNLPRDKMIRAALSDSHVPNIMSNVQNKILTDQYNRFPSVARTISKRLTANDFKDHTGNRLIGRDTLLEEIGPGGEIVHGSLQDTAFTFSVDTYAKMFGIDRTHLINDDLGALDEMPRIIARGAALKVESVFWTLVLGNTDSFFGTANANLLTDVLASGGLTAAVMLARQMTDEDGEPVLVSPKFLVLPPELEVTGDELYAATHIVVAGATDVSKPDGNSYSGKYKPEVVPYLSNSKYTGYSATGWYLFGDPGDVAAFGLAYLNGQQAPTIESEPGAFNTLGIQWRGYLDFGVCQIDAKGGVKSTGAG